MRHRTSEDTMFLVGGALLGAAAMYLMDPEMGKRRRSQLASNAEDAYGNARGALGQGLESLASHAKGMKDYAASHAADWSGSATDSARGYADQARDLAADLSDRAQSHGSAISHFGSHLWDRARGLGSRLANLRGSVADHASDIHGDVSDYANQWSNWLSRRGNAAKSQARSWLGHEEQSGLGAVGVTSTALGCCAVGAGLMYFLDPNRGHARRNMIVEKASSLVCQTGQTMRTTGRHLANQLRGFAFRSKSAATSMMGGHQEVDSDALVQRIRSEMGHWNSASAHQVQIMADTDGSVTVTGNVSGQEVDSLLGLLHRVPGVSHVINRLNVSQSIDAGTMAAHS